MTVDLTAKKVTRGRITNMRTSISQPFSLNPSSLRIKKGAHLTEDPIPGFTDPLLRYASGKVRSIAFSLDIDGEITRRRFGAQVANANYPDRNTIGSFDISGEIEWYESLAVATDPTLPGADGGLDRVLLTIGSYLNGVQCFVEEANPTIHQFDPDLNPTKATIELMLKVVVDQNDYANAYWDNLTTSG